MAETLVPGRQAQLYGAVESPYGTPPTLLATHALRANLKSSFNPFNRVNGPEKKQSPGVVSRFDRRSTLSATLDGLLRPSGTLNTLPELNTVFEHAFGSKSNTTLATTVSVSPAPTATVFTLASALALAKYQGILITLSGVKYLRYISDLTGSVVTVFPPLPSAPSGGEAVKGVLTYRLASAITSSLAIAEYRSTDTTLSRILKGLVCEKLALAFAQNTEATWTATLKGKTQSTPAPTKPGAFTTVGAQNPPSGLAGELYVGTSAYKFIKLDAEVDTGVVLRDDSYGCASPEGILETGRRAVTLALDARIADESVIYDNAEAGTKLPVFKQTGYTEGNIIGLYAPNVDFTVPDDDDPDDVPTWPFKGVCCESADGQNDELILCLA